MSIQKLPNELLFIVIEHLDGCSLYCLWHTHPKLKASICEAKRKAIICDDDIADPSDVLLKAMELNYVGIVNFVVPEAYISVPDMTYAASQASARGNVEVVKALLDLEPHINYSDALWEAAKYNKVKVVGVLLQWERDEAAPKRWRTLRLPFEVAKSAEVRKLLVQHNPKDVLPRMIEGGYVEETRELLPGLLETGRITPDAKMLEIATVSYNIDNIGMVKLLRQLGYHSQRAYMLAISRSNLDLADLLNGDPNAMSDGRRPLHNAVWASSVVSIKYLLDKGVDQTQLDMYGRTPFDIAMYTGHELAIHALNWGHHRYPIRNRIRYSTTACDAGRKRRRVD
ncbi:hypothetical protein IFM5058_11060 [Aspergillus udagawae]|nr:hypothetical protein IFM5058_11060 [Aspergillus udagawae]